MESCPPMALPSLTGLSLDRLNSFLQVAEARGLARAAPGDPVRQSQLSRQLKELENALGQVLFDRSSRGFELIDYFPSPEVYVGCAFASWKL